MGILQIITGRSKGTEVTQAVVEARALALFEARRLRQEDEEVEVKTVYHNISFG